MVVLNWNSCASPSCYKITNVNRAMITPAVCLSVWVCVYVCVSSWTIAVCLCVCVCVCVCVACQEEFTSVEVEYCCLPGWQCSTEHIRQFCDLPVNAQAYVNKIEELTSVRGNASRTRKIK